MTNSPSSPGPPLCLVALGSNLGNRLANLQAARDRLRALAEADRPFLQASVYHSSPVGCPPEAPDFFNTVVAFHFAGSAFNLLAATRRIETELGRHPIRPPNAPRPIDLDLLGFGDQVIDHPDLTLPHPRMTMRRFVLEPLAEILPDLKLPGDPRTIAGHLDRLPGSSACAPAIVAAEW